MPSSVYSSVALGKHRAWAPALHHLFDAADCARVLTVYLLGQRFGCPSEICERIAANFQAAPAEFGVTTIARRPSPDRPGAKRIAVDRADLFEHSLKG